MHSHEKRSFMAEMTIKYCDGKSRKAESVFGSTRGDRIPPLRGVRGVFVLEVQTHNTPLTPSRGEFDLGFS